MEQPRLRFGMHKASFSSSSSLVPRVLMRSPRSGSPAPRTPRPSDRPRWKQRLGPVPEKIEETPSGKRSLSPPATSATKRARPVDDSDSDSDDLKKVTPTTSSDGSGDEEHVHEAMRSIIVAAAPQVPAEKRAGFLDHYGDDWIEKSLAMNRADPIGFYRNFKSKLDSRFPSKKKVCDRCDGPHDANACPHFSKERDDHPDADRALPPMAADGGNAYLPGDARVVPQPGDGSCLFHSLGYGHERLFGRPLAASALRGLLMDWLLEHQETKIADTPVKDWVKWDSGCSVPAYAKRMRLFGWGGGIEMAAYAHKFGVDVHVYERVSGTRHPYKRISRFEKTPLESRHSLTVLYRGGVHYDAILPRSDPVDIDDSPPPRVRTPFRASSHLATAGGSPPAIRGAGIPPKTPSYPSSSKPSSTW
ncbi:hypothetical protein CTAYLR_005850 [Chrysophaeum taylorii]|uniref:Ubiquitin thioesterase OTU n=1 Tax=Chrysophaeum taylorii TaxID=2483200 RepID=A0AAD7UNT6_9STRA|nr:hypothetical protein CTAYLR_005850 [Chrysophaeum taylorii]